MSTITLTPARGRDYSSRQAVKDDLVAHRDFMVADMSSRWDGKPCNLPDLRHAGIATVNVRYQNLRKVAVFNLKELAS